MASTNHTTNYNLSQFVGTDKPAWLTDYNGDMGRIDTGIYNAQSTATGADGKADTANTSIGTLANLTTTAKTDLVSAINEVDSNADTAQNTATGASETANTAKTTADGLQRYITLTDFGTATVSVSGGTINSTITSVGYALNADGTYGKVYGRVRYTCNTAGEQTITLNTNSHLQASSQFTIAMGAFFTVVSGGVYQIINSTDITVKTDGTVTITLPSAVGNGSIVTVWLPPCIYYYTDFGDTPTPE